MILRLLQRLCLLTKQTDNFYFKGVDCLKEKWAKYIEVKGEYID